MRYRALPESGHELVALRPIVAADIADWYACLAQPVVLEHTSWNLRSADDLAHYPGASASTDPESLLRFAIVLRSSGRLIGSAGFHSVSPRDRRAELAYDLSPEYWGKGIATHVCSLLVRWAHAEADVLRVQATVLESNRRSMAVLERCGFVLEGVLHGYRMVRGVPGNFRMYAHVRAGDAV